MKNELSWQIYKNSTEFVFTDLFIFHSVGYVIHLFIQTWIYDGPPGTNV